jgi:hypothetical protein
MSCPHLEHAGVSRRDGILRIGSDIVSGFPSFIAAEKKLCRPVTESFGHRYVLFAATSREAWFPIMFVIRSGDLRPYPRRRGDRIRTLFAAVY